MEYEILTKKAHGVAQNTYHLIWVTKYRYPMFRSKRMRSICLQFIEEAAAKYGLKIFECEVMSDHVHLFVRLPTEMSVSKAFQLMKGFTSFRIRKMMPWLKKYKAVWSSFTFSRTVGNVTGGVIKHYIKESNTSGQYGSQKSLKQF